MRMNLPVPVCQIPVRGARQSPLTDFSFKTGPFPVRETHQKLAFPSKGLVVGAFGEGSDDLHSLVNTLAESRLRAQGLTRGREGSEKELGIIVGQIRRRLSTASIRALMKSPPCTHKLVGYWSALSKKTGILLVGFCQKM